MKGGILADPDWWAIMVKR